MVRKRIQRTVDEDAREEAISMYFCIERENKNGSVIRRTWWWIYIYIVYVGGERNGEVKFNNIVE